MLKLSRLMSLILISLLPISVIAKPYIKDTYSDDMDHYDNSKMEVLVKQASKVCIALMNNNFIITHWLYNPSGDEIYLTGHTKGFIFFSRADCSYIPSNHSAIAGVTGKKSIKTDNYSGVTGEENFTTDNSSK